MMHWLGDDEPVLAVVLPHGHGVGAAAPLFPGQ